MHRLKFVNLGESIIQSLSIGIVAFSPDMQIIEMNQAAKDLLHNEPTIHEALFAGTKNSVWPDWKMQLPKVITDGKRNRYNAIPYTKDDQRRLIDITCVPLLDNEDSEIIGGAIVLEDVTERVTIEKRLASAERLAAIGKVAGKVAHELNNPMDGILRYISLSQRVINNQQPAKAIDYLDHCKTGITRMAKVVKDLLEFSRFSEPNETYTPLEKIINESIRAMSTHIEAAGLVIECDLDKTIEDVRSGGFFQVFCNLIKNAADASVPGGSLLIKARRSEDNNIIISFEDTGHGIKEEELESIFEPFFTTKELGKGTGLGLSICKDIINKYGGEIAAANNEQGGSVFTIMIPCEQICLK